MSDAEVQGTPDAKDLRAYGFSPFAGKGLTRSPSRGQDLKRKALSSPQLSEAAATSSCDGCCEKYFLEIKQMLLDNADGMRNLSEKIDKAAVNIESLNQTVKQLEEKNADLERVNSYLLQKIDVMSSKLRNTENYSRRNSLIFHNLIDDVRNVSAKQCEIEVKKFIQQKLELDASKIEFDIVHGIPSRGQPRTSGSGSKIIAKFVKRSDRESVMDAFFRQRRQNSSSGLSDVYVSADMCFETRRIRRELVPFLQRARRDGKRCKLRGEILVIESKSFTVDRNGDLVEVNRPNEGHSRSDGN